MAIPKLPPRSYVNIVICLAGIIAFILLVIYPQYQSQISLDHEIANLTTRIEEQKILAPLFKDLTTKGRSKIPEDLPFPQRQKLSKEEARKISFAIQAVIQKNDFTVENIVPDVNSLMDGSGFLKLSLVAIGDFFRLRDVLLQLSEIPYLEHIEMLQIETYDDLIKVSLKLWFAQES
jgi:hypothetical protein